MLPIGEEVGVRGNGEPTGGEDEGASEHEEGNAPEEAEGAQGGEDDGHCGVAFVEVAGARPEEAEDAGEEVARVAAHAGLGMAIVNGPIAPVAGEGVVERGAAEGTEGGFRTGGSGGEWFRIDGGRHGILLCRYINI